MSYHRRMTRPDANQQPIVDALRSCGVHVWPIGQPCDLLTYYRHCWLPLEIKRPSSRPRKDQAAQNEFLAQTLCPVVRTPQEALQAVLGYVPHGFWDRAADFCDVDSPCGPPSP